MSALRRTVIGAVVMAVIGLGAVGCGVYLVTTDRVECEIGRELQPGETCESARPRGRGTITLDYEEQRASNKRVGYVAIGFGLLAVGYGAWTVYKQARTGATGTPPSS